MLDFTIYKFLAAVFTPEFTISSSLKIANCVVDLLGKYVGEEPTILPIPKGAPPELPRIVFSSPDKKWSLNLSPERTNLFFNISPTLTKEEINTDEFSLIASEFFANYQKALDLQVQRTAFVTERSTIRDDALTFILDKYCNKEQTTKGQPFFNAKRFEIHSLKKYEWEGFNLNSWVRMKFAPIKNEGGEAVPAILVINDLNTLPFDEAPEVAFSASEINTFYEKIPQHLGKILKLYFD
jgi:hypothetical protein